MRSVTAGGAPIDHIELSGAPHDARADARNFVLCSGGEYDRSPCGTGTSAVMAALHRARVARVRAAVAAGEHHGRPVHRMAHARQRRAT